MGQIAGGVLQKKLDLMGERPGFFRGLLHRRIRRPDNHMIMPWDGKEDATIVRSRDEDGAFTGEEVPVKNDVDTLARGNDGYGFRFVQ